MAWPWVGGPLMRQMRATHAFFFVPRPPKRGLSAHAAHWPQSSRMQPSHSPEKMKQKLVHTSRGQKFVMMLDSE